MIDYQHSLKIWSALFISTINCLAEIGKWKLKYEEIFWKIGLGANNYSTIISTRRIAVIQEVFCLSIHFFFFVSSMKYSLAKSPRCSQA